MSDTTEIAWTDATWNPVRGCARVSPGCGGSDGGGCYAERMAHRFSGPGGAYEGLTRMTAHGPRWTGKVRLVPELLDWPLRWRGAKAARAEARPSRIFVNSMSDLFHEDVPDEFIAAVFGVMACSKQVFQVLTKRPERMLRWLRWLEKETDANAPELAVQLAANRLGVKLPLHPIKGTLRCYPWPLRNVHLGVSVEDQARADERVPLLLQTPAAVRFLSVEPMLGPVDLDTRKMFPPSEAFAPPPKLDWVIVGGESGPGARPCSVDWISDVVAECRSAKVPVFVKQLGARPTLIEAVLGEWGDGVRFTGDGRGTNRGRALLRDKKGGDISEWPEALRVRDFQS